MIRINKFIIFLVFILIITFCTAGCANAPSETKNTKSTAEIGSAMKDAAAELKNSGESGISKAVSEHHNRQDTDHKNAVMSIMGYTIDKTYFKYRVSLYSACGSSDPVSDAAELMKQQVAEWDFAQANGLLPSEEDINDYCNSIRKNADSDEESRKTMNELIKNMGLTEDEYFNIIQPKYEVSFILVSQNIKVYCRENNEDPPKYQNVDVEIIDRDYINSLKEIY